MYKIIGQTTTTGEDIDATANTHTEAETQLATMLARPDCEDACIIGPLYNDDDDDLPF